MNPARKILIADDNETVLMALEYSMHQAGFIVLKAADGEKAFQLAQKEKPDIIISDITMPEMDGIELCKNIRALPELTEVPFIFLTAHGETDERVKGLRTGADDYMVKPFEVEELIARIEVLCKHVHRRGFSNTLTGNIKELSIPDTLQIFAQSKKEGNLKIRGDMGDGFISFRNGCLMEASYNGMMGEDALVALLRLDSGHFHYEPKEVTSGSFAKPVNYAMLEAIRLIDEHCDNFENIPEMAKKLQLIEGGSVADPDAEEMQRVLRKGAITGLEAWKKSGFSRIRAEVALASLVRDGAIGYEETSVNGDHALKQTGKLFRMLFSFTDEYSAASFLFETAETYQVKSSHGIKSGVADFLKLTIGDVLIQIFSLRGEKKFSFLWEPMLPTSDAVIFLVNSASDFEHAAFFKDRLSKKKYIPFLQVTANRDMHDKETALVGGKEQISEFFANVLASINTST